MLSKSRKLPVTNSKLTGRLLLQQFSHPQLPLLKSAAIAGVLATVFTCVMWITFAMLTQAIVVNSEPMSEQSNLLVWLISSALLKVIAIRVQSFFGDTASRKIRTRIRHEMLALWRNQSPLAEHQQSPASAATQWVEDIEAMDGYFSRYWPQKILAVVSPLIILGVVAWINWLCALLLLISAPLIPLFMILVGMGAEHLNQNYSLTRQRLAGHFLNRVANLTTIKLLNSEQSIFAEVESRSNHYREVIMRTLRIAFLSSTVLEFFTSVAIASLAIYIGFSLYGAITWGPATTINLFSGLLILILAPEFFQPLRTLSQYYHDQAAALGAANNLVDLFNAPISDPINPEMALVPIDNDADVPEPGRHQVRLVLDNVSIGYSDNQVLSRHIHVDLCGNQLLAITGASGTGKSTLLNTIANYMPPLSGHITLFPSQYPHTPIAYLPQQPWIKNASLLDNIREFAPNATTAEILACLGSLGLSSEFATRENVLETPLGEHGQGFSGGQMQRVALSRVLLNPTPIILLDEPTAKLDLQTKGIILSAIKSLQQQAIVIVATHDPALINLADSCINLDSVGEEIHAVLV